MEADKQNVAVDKKIVESDDMDAGSDHENLYLDQMVIENNKKFKDNSSKLFFRNAILCAQFLRDYIKIPLLKKVKPEDIEDVTERYTPLFTSEREADTVKKIHLEDGKSLFLISLIEHKTKVDYNVIMKLLRYMCYIWEDYEKEMQRENDRLKKEQEEQNAQEAGKEQEEEGQEPQLALYGGTEKQAKRVLTSNHKDFKYPPILPVVYFEGTGNWTAVMSLKERIYFADIFEKYIPDYTYEVIRPHDYSDQQLMEKNNEMGLIMFFNKLQSLEDLKGISEWKDSQENILKGSPQHILDIIARFMTILLNRLNLPEEEVEDFISRIKEGNMPELFENFERVDVPKMRQEIEEDRKEIEEDRKEIEEDRKEIEEDRKEIEEDRKEIEEGRKEIEKAWIEIKDEQRKLREEWCRIQEAKREKL